MWTKTPFILSLSAVTALASCTGQKVSDTSSGSCDAPTAFAGDDQSITLGSTVTLDATGSSVCESYAEDAIYTWSFEQIPVDSTVDSSAFSDNQSNTASAPSFIPDSIGDFTLALSIADPDHESSPDLMVVSVSSGDAVPSADCGGDLEGLVDAALTLDGSASADPEGAELSYSWSLTGPSCTDLTSDDLYNTGGPTPSFVPDCEGIFIVSLVVSDGLQWSDAALCAMDIAGGNHLPVADAGDSENLGACADNPLQMDGWGSYDLDGDDLIYEWSLVEAPSDSAVTEDDISDLNAADPTLSWDVSGSYSLQLQVSDGIDWSAPDVVTVSIAHEAANNSPVANAGEDQSVETEAECSSTSYVWSCPDCGEVDVELDGSASEDEDGDNLNFHWTENTGSMSFTNAYGALTDGVIAEQAAEYGVTNSMNFMVNLDVSDCAESSNDTVMVSYSCTGESP